MSSDQAEIQKSVRSYMTVFGMLMVFTVITVAASRFHLAVPVGRAYLAGCETERSQDRIEDGDNSVECRIVRRDRIGSERHDRHCRTGRAPIGSYVRALLYRGGLPRGCA